MREGWRLSNPNSGRDAWQRDDNRPLFIQQRGNMFYLLSVNRDKGFDTAYRYPTLEQAMLVVETMDLLNEDLPE